MAALAGLEKLRVLKIGSCSLSDASLRHFLHLPVEELDMSHVEEGWIVEYRGGGHCRFTVSYAGLQALLTYQGSLPNLKRLVLRKTQFSDAQKQALASLPGAMARRPQARQRPTSSRPSCLPSSLTPCTGCQPVSPFCCSSTISSGPIPLPLTCSST